MPSIETGLMAIVAKYGWLKLITLGASLGGAALMAAFRPPLTRKELFLQAIVALSCSFLFGDTLANMIDYWFDFINKETSTWEAWMQFVITIHGLCGALSWGIFGGIAHLRDKLGKQSIVESIKEIKDVAKD